MNELTVASGEGGRNALVVDDNVALAENIVEIVELAGYVAWTAASAEEALPKALAGQVAFIVTDYRLPGLNGAEPKTRVVRLLARPENGSVEKFRLGGAEQWILARSDDVANPPFATAARP